MNILRALKDRFLSGSARSVEAKKNILLTLSLRIFTVFPSILLVPLTISYVNSEKYGLWLTLSSVLTMMNLFDFGLGNGFRNRFAEAKALGNEDKATQYVSTTYFIITIIAILLASVLEIFNISFDWCSFLNVSKEYDYDLRHCFSFLIAFFCINLVANLITSLLTADQKPSWASVLQAIGQVLSLIAIWVLTIIKGTGTLSDLAFLYTGIPCFVLIIGTFYFFNISPKYKKYRPRISSIRFPLIKSIMSLGIKFFVVTLCSLCIFQLINIVIVRELGPTTVSEFNVAQKYFNILYMPSIIILTPIWSAVTDAYVSGDYLWLDNARKRLEQLWMVSIGIAIIMVIFSDLFYGIWVGDRLSIPNSITISVAVYTVMQIIGTAYMYMINGIGTISLQLIVYVVFAIIAWPSFILAARLYGIMGMIVIPVLFYSVQAVLGKIQLSVLLSKKGKGIWIR